MSDFKLTKAQEKAMDLLISDATYCALAGGSRSGKTFLLVRSVLVRALREPGSRHLIARFRFNSLKSTVINDTLVKVIRLCFPSLPPALSMMNKTDWYMTLPNESEVWFTGLDTDERTEKVLGSEYATIYLNECSQIPYFSVNIVRTRLAQKTSLNTKFYVDLNPTTKRHWVYRMFVDKVDPESGKPLLDPGDYGFSQINPIDNQDHLDPKYLRMLEGLPEAARKRFLYGQFSDDNEGALWTEELLAQNRVLGHEGSLPDWLRVVIAVDPSGTKGEEDSRSDEVGIVVMALGTDSHAYVLEDLSGNYSPEQWSDIVSEAYIRTGADRVVAEVNYGGALVEQVLRAKNPDLPYREVRASRGKVIRAEPIAALYEQHKIHHVGYFEQLEDQMCSMLVSGYIGLRSPDRLDAMVWAATELFPGLTKQESNKPFTPPQKVTRERSATRYGGSTRRRRI
jgi:hypothetical protein